jgi:hypothetical protein
LVFEKKSNNGGVGLIWIGYEFPSGTRSFRSRRANAYTDRNISIVENDGKANGIWVGQRTGAARTFIPLTSDLSGVRLGQPEVLWGVEVYKRPRPANSSSGQLHARVSHNEGGTVEELDAEGRIIHTFDLAHIVDGLIYIGETLCVGTWDGIVSVRQAGDADLHPVHRMPWHGQASPALYDGGDASLAALHYGYLRVFDLKKNLDIERHSNNYLTLDIVLLIDLPKRGRCISISRGGDAAVWNVVSGKLEGKVPDNRHKVREACLSDCERFLLLKTHGMLVDREEWLWCLETSRLLARFNMEKSMRPRQLDLESSVPKIEASLEQLIEEKFNQPLEPALTSETELLGLLRSVDCWRKFPVISREDETLDIKCGDEGKWVSQYPSTVNVMVGRTVVVGDMSGGVHLLRQNAFSK